jgi:hypothetical protein
MRKEYGVYGSFSVNSSDFLFILLQVSLFNYTIKTSFALSDWKLYCKVKPWSAAINIGPLFFKLIDEDKLTNHIYKILKENEDKMHSES